MQKHRRPKPVDTAAELARMSEVERLELYMALDQVRAYLTATPGSSAVVDANRLWMAARLRGVKLPARAFALAVDWLDRHGSVPPQSRD